MERLTYKAKSNCGFVWAIKTPKQSMQEAIDRLAAYEDTGLEPEEITVQLEILRKYSEAADGIGLKRLRELVKAEKAGRLVVLPCKLTDTVYIVESVMRGKKHIGEKIVSAQIDHVTIGESGNPVLDVCTETGNWYGPLETSDFWTTRQEAEEALRKEADNG